MSIQPENPAEILHNPSRRCEGFSGPEAQKGLKRANPSQSFTGRCEGFRRDLERGKYSNNKYICIYSINPSRSHAHPRARCVCAREGVCEEFREGFG